MSFTAFYQRLLSFMVLALLVACTPKPDPADTEAVNAEARKNALIRFVNVTTYAEPVDLYLDDARALPSVGKDKATDYSEQSAERHEIGLRIPSNPTPVVTDSESLGAGERYTVVGFTKMDGAPGIVVFRDDVSQPEAGKARIRLIHVAEGASDLDIYPSGAKESVVDGVHYNSDSWVEVDPGVKSLEIRREGENVAALNLPGLTLAPGKTYTIVVAADENRNLRVVPLENFTSAQHGSLSR